MFKEGTTSRVWKNVGIEEEEEEEEGGGWTRGPRGLAGGGPPPVPLKNRTTTFVGKLPINEVCFNHWPLLL